MKKGIIIASIVVFAIIIAACSRGSVEASSTYMIVEINPAIEFLIDEDDKVVSFTARNEDAEIVIGELDFVGMAIEDALELFLEEAVLLGYLDVNREDNVILLTLYNEDEDEENGMRERMTEHAKGYLVRNRIAGAVVDSGLTMDDLIAMAATYEVSVGHLRIALAASLEDEELTLEEALEMAIPELMVILQAKHQARIQQFRAEFLQERLAMRNSLREEAQARVEAHRANLDETTPEQARARINQVQSEFMERRQEMINEYRARQIERRNQMTP